MNWQVRNPLHCTTDGCTAKAEIEALREKVAALTQAHQTVTTLWEEAMGQLAEMTKLWENEYRLRCEAQARIKELREALETISDGENWGEDGCWESSSYPDEIAMEALAIPTDTSALDAALEEAYSKGYDVGCADTTGDT